MVSSSLRDSSDWPEEPRCWPEFRDRMRQPDRSTRDESYPEHVCCCSFESGALMSRWLVRSHWLFENKESGMILSHLGRWPNHCRRSCFHQWPGHLKTLLAEIRLRFLRFQGLPVFWIGFPGPEHLDFGQHKVTVVGSAGTLLGQAFLRQDLKPNGCWLGQARAAFDSKSSWQDSSARMEASFCNSGLATSLASVDRISRGLHEVPYLTSQASW